jgi:hypothetical protein
MLIGLDETLHHQTPEPFSVIATSDHRFFDRYWFSGMSPDGSIAFFSGTGRYPNMGTRDAFLNVVIGERQHNLRIAAPLEVSQDEDSLSAVVGGYRVTVVEPFRRIVLKTSDDRVAAELEFTTDKSPHLETKHRELAGTRVIQEQQRYNQVGVWNGWIETPDGRVTVKNWWGDRDHSWGTRVDVGGLEPREMFRRTRNVTIWCSFSTQHSWGYFQTRDFADGSPRYLDGSIHRRDCPEARVLSVDSNITYSESAAWTHAEFTIGLDDGSTVFMTAEPHTIRPWASKGGGYNRGFTDGLGFGARRGEVTEYDVYDLPDLNRVLRDGVEIDPGHREQLARVTLDGNTGWAHLPIMPRSGDMGRQNA